MLYYYNIILLYYIGIIFRLHCYYYITFIIVVLL